MFSCTVEGLWWWWCWYWWSSCGSSSSGIMMIMEVSLWTLLLLHQIHVHMCELLICSFGRFVPHVPFDLIQVSLLPPLMTDFYTAGWRCWHSTDACQFLCCITGSFRVTVKYAWNSLPTNVTASTSLPSFKRQLKTFLFIKSFPSL